jgi:hypothetical protein
MYVLHNFLETLCLDVCVHFKYTLEEILDWYTLVEAISLQQTITTLANSAYQTALALDPGGTNLMCDLPFVVARASTSVPKQPESNSILSVHSSTGSQVTGPLMDNNCIIIPKGSKAQGESQGQRQKLHPT